MGTKAEDLLSDVRPLAPAEFERIRQLAHQTFGLDLKHGKEELVSARLRRLAQAGGHRSFQDYYKSVVEDRTGAALLLMIDALATNHTSFLREPDHFDFLKQQILPNLMGRDAIEIWSAACATGEEAWTLAMLLSESAAGRRIHIHASDISNKALNFARAAIYPQDRCQGIPQQWISKYFKPGTAADGYAVLPAVRRHVSFRRINLVQAYSWPRAFPIIFCRNVMIYFDHATQERVVRQLSEYLEPGGYLFVGHAESLSRVGHNLEYVKPAVYRKAGKKSTCRKSW